MAKNQLYATKTLSFIRKERRITQQEMADIFAVVLKRDVSIELYRKWEYGNRGVSTENALAISRELDTSMLKLWETK